MPILLNTPRSRFEVESDGLTAVADFILALGQITVTHIIVPPEMRGGSVASGLAAHIVEYARAEKLKIEPQCSFMAAYLQKHPETRDLAA